MKSNVISLILIKQRKSMLYITRGTMLYNYA